MPSGVLAGDDRIMIDVVDRPDPATAPGVGTVDIALASGQETFRKVVTVSLPYSEAILRELDISEAGLSMWYFDTEDGRLGVASRPHARCGPGGCRCDADGGIPHHQRTAAAGGTGRRGRHAPGFRCPCRGAELYRGGRRGRCGASCPGKSPLRRRRPGSRSRMRGTWSRCP